MANTIIPKRSSVAGKVPLSTNLQVGEIAVNLADGLIFTKNASGTVISLGSSGGTNLPSQTGNGGKHLTTDGTTASWASLTSSQITTALGFTPYNATNPNGYTSNTGTVTSVSLNLPAVFSVTGSPVTTSGTLSASLASQTANTVWAAPNGSTGAPTFRALVAADIPALTLENLPDSWAKRSVRVATTANITLSGTQTIDGVPVAVGDRVLVKNQTTTSQNGIYVVASGAWSRATDADTSSKLAAAIVAVDSGTTNGGLTYDTDFKSTDTLGTTAMSWFRQVDAGLASSTNPAMNGTVAIGTSINYARADHVHPVDTSRAPAAGSTSITTLGTVATGTWQAGVISSTYGGTGVNNGGRTLAINTNSGTLAFTNASTTLTVANTASVSGTNTGDQTITLTGDVTGSGTGSFAATLANSGVTAGTYTKVTVDAKGRVTTGASLASADLPTYTGTLTSSQVTTALGFTPESTSNKGAANGYASLDASGKVPSAQLPSYVDDVLEYANLASFPGTGESAKIYVALDSNKAYRWSGSAYIEISASPGSTDAVSEGSTNLYFTQARARNAISVSGSLSYNASTGVISYTQPTNVSAFTNDAGYLTEITSGQVTTALGYTPVNKAAANTWTANQTFSNPIYANSDVYLDSSSAGLVRIGNNLGAGNLFIGGASQWGGITIGQSTDTHTLNIDSGATASGKTKTINIGGNGVSGSTTIINVGSSVAGATTNVNTYGTWTHTGTFSLSGQTIAVASGGTGANSASGARTNLGLVIGTNVQAWDADLDAIAALAGTSGFLKKTAANTWALDSNTYLTANQSITFSGDASGSGSTAVTLTLANSGVSAGTYTNATITVDAKGRVTSASSGSAGGGVTSFNTRTGAVTLSSSDVTTALGFTPYNSTNPNGYITSSALSGYLPLSGGTMNGLITFTTPGVDGGGGTGIKANPNGWTRIDPNGSRFLIPVTGTEATTAVREIIDMERTDNWTHMMSIYSDGSAQFSNLRIGGDSTPASGNQVLHAGNYTSYSPSLTGSGASGTWSINVTGSAGSVAWTNVSGRPTALSSFTNDSGYITSSSPSITTPTITGARETRVAVPASNINLATGNYFTRTISGATTLTVSNVPASGTAVSLILDLTNGGSASITWWSGVKWAGGTTPTLTASGRDVLGFYTHDGGTTWTGLVLGKDVK